MPPVVAVVGRPNVGKSTLVNRILGRREAIVEEQPGVTRDRKTVEADWRGRPFFVVDTGVWLAAEGGLEHQVSRQAERAVAEADVVLVVVDATVGITEEDARVAKLLRRSGRPAIVVANKVDAESRESDAWAFGRLGLGPPMAVSALHGRGVGDLLDAVVAALPAEIDGPAISTSVAEPEDERVPAVVREFDDAHALVALALDGTATGRITERGATELIERLRAAGMDDEAAIHDILSSLGHEPEAVAAAAEPEPEPEPVAAAPEPEPEPEPVAAEAEPVAVAAAEEDQAIRHDLVAEVEAESLAADEDELEDEDRALLGGKKKKDRR